MESDTELPDDEEEMLVYVEFEDFANSNVFNNEELQLDMIGLDTDHPIMQVNGKFFEGTYEDAMGTYMFFEKDVKLPVDDPVFDKTPSVKYFDKTKKVLKMQRIFVKPRTEVLGDSEHPECLPNTDIIKEAGVPPRYQEEALGFWRKIRDDRIDALSAYLEKHRIREEKRSKGIVPDSDSDEDNPFAIYKQKPAKNLEKYEHLKENMEIDHSKCSRDKNENDTAPKEIFDNDLTIFSKSPCETTNAKSVSSALQEDSEQNTNQLKENKKESAKAVQKKKGKQNECNKRNKKKQMEDVNLNLSEKLHSTESSVKSDTNLDNSKKHAEKIHIEADKKETISEDVSDAPVNTNNKITLNNDVLSDAVVLLNDDVVIKEMNEIKKQTKELGRLTKREAKMKELSERLKKAVNECKANT